MSSISISPAALVKIVKDSSLITSIISYHKGCRDWNSADVIDAVHSCLCIKLELDQVDVLNELLDYFNLTTVTGEEVFEYSLTLPTGVVIRQCLIKELNSGLYFSADSSYLEQDVDAVLSPYGNGHINLAE